MYKNNLPWEFNELEITLFTELNKVKDNRRYYNYELYYKNELIFKGSEYSPSPMFNDYSDLLCLNSQLDLLSWLTLQTGDTIESDIAEEISLLIYDYDNKNQ